MPRISNFEILQKREQPVLSIRTRSPVGSLPAIIGESYGKMAAYLKEIGEHLSDVPFVAYYNMDMQDLDIEIGFPVDKVLPENGNIKPDSIHAGKVVFCMYRGPYREIEATYHEMAQWIVENDHIPVGTAYEHYFNGPGFPESEMLTMIVMPLK